MPCEERGEKAMMPPRLTPSQMRALDLDRRDPERWNYEGPDTYEEYRDNLAERERDDREQGRDVIDEEYS